MILNSFDDLNWAAVGASFAAAFAVGLVWFSPPILGGFWARQVSRYAQIPEGEITRAASRPRTLAKWLVGIAVTAVALALAVEAVAADSAGEGVVAALVLGLGLAATSASWPPIFARMPWGWWLVNTGAFLLMLIVMGAILGSWQ